MSYFSSSGFSKLDTIVTEKTPWTYVSMELGLPSFSFAGGLGILAGDIYLQAKTLQIPFTAVTLFYPWAWRQKIVDFYQQEDFYPASPLEAGLEKKGSVEIKANSDTVSVDYYVKKDEAASIVALSEPGLRELYAGTTSDEHRLYQEAVLGFAGYKALKELNSIPSVLHINEASSVFFALAHLDDSVVTGLRLNEALKSIQCKTIFTNHTLVQAAVAAFSRDQFERYIINNLVAEEVKEWLRSLVTDSMLRRTTIAFELAGKINGVSTMHAKKAGRDFKKKNGESIAFTTVTNGIFLTRWLQKDIALLLERSFILNKKGIINENSIDILNEWNVIEAVDVKKSARESLEQYLKTRQDQYGNSIDIPQDTILAVWAKRFAGYKRAHMLFEDIATLTSIVKKENVHVLLSGSAHPTDNGMKQELQQILQRIESSPILKERVHYIQQYDLDLATYLVAGADIWFNVPEVGKEACGTSWMKAIANLTVLVSTEDGGVADIATDSYLKIEGTTYDEEVSSLYSRLTSACNIVNDKDQWKDKVIKQLAAYLLFVSGERMWKEYADLARSID